MVWFLKIWFNLPNWQHTNCFYIPSFFKTNEIRDQSGKNELLNFRNQILFFLFYRWFQVNFFKMKLKLFTTKNSIGTGMNILALYLSLIKCFTIYKITIQINAMTNVAALVLCKLLKRFLKPFFIKKKLYTC